MQMAARNCKLFSKIMKHLFHYISVLLLFGLNGIAAGQDCWGNFRGNSALTGVAEVELPGDLRLEWTFKTGDAIKAAPVVCDGIIVAGSLDGNLYGITREGNLKWKINTGNGIESPALIDNGMVYVGNLDGSVFAIELETGKTRWTYDTEGQIMGSPNLWKGQIEGKPGTTRVLIIGSYDYYLHGIDALTGEGLWKYEADNFINGTPAIYKGYAIFGGCDGMLHQVRVSDGKLKERRPVATYVAGSVTVVDWITYVGDYDGKFTALDIQHGKEQWSYKNDKAELPFIASPSVDGNRVFIGNRDKYVYCFNRTTGDLIWSVNTRGRVDASPVLAGDDLLVATMRGDVMVMDATSGEVKWTYEIGSPVMGNPAVTDERVIVGAGDGRIYCFGSK